MDVFVLFCLMFLRVFAGYDTGKTGASSDLLKEIFFIYFCLMSCGVCYCIWIGFYWFPDHFRVSSKKMKKGIDQRYVQFQP